MSVMDYYRDKYDGQGKSDAYIKEQAEERIEKELEKIKGYASYGMDARQAYPLYQDQKKYGFTREEAIRNNSGFERFNTNIDNITFINDKYSEQGIQVDKVSDIAPNAREYYANGYRDIREILDLNYLEQKLNVTCERAMQIDSVLRKKLK